MTAERFPDCRVHPTSLVEAEVRLGNGTSVWDNVHIRHGAQIGQSCIVGEKTYVAYDVVIGDFCKLNASVYVCAGVTIEDYAMISAHVVFTNDLFPRSFDKTLDGLASSDPTEETLSTRVGRGVTIGANATIGPGIELGEFSMVGMGSVVTRSIPPHGLVVGNPARLLAFVCTCGPTLVRAKDWESHEIGHTYHCERCQRVFERSDVGLNPRDGGDAAGA